MEAVYWYNVTPKDDASASTAPANIIYSYTARIRGVDVTLPPEDAGPSSYEVGDSVWVKIPHGRCTTQFGKGTIMGVYSPHSVLVDGTPRHVKDVRPVRGADATYCCCASDDDEAPMLYLPREDPIASESDRGQCGPGDTSEDDDVAKSVPLRRSSRLRRPALRCTVCDSQIREECEGNVPGHSKRARTCLACRAEPIWLPQAYLTRGDLEPARGNLHVCKFLRDLTIIQICTVTAEWAIFVLSAFARRTCYITRKEGRMEGENQKERERERERRKEQLLREREKG